MSVLVAALVAAVGVPALAVAARAKTPTVPDCAHLSRTAIAKVVNTGKLSLKGQTGNLCSFEGHIPGHYKPLLQIQVVPGTASLFSLAEGAAMTSAKKQHATFATVSPKLKLGTAAFSVTSTANGGKLPLCKPGQKPPQIGPPRCKGEPAYTKIEVVAYGPSKPKSLVLMVTVAVAVQKGDVSLPDMITLDKDILAHTIH
jgi:hypothetical protein